MTDTTPSPALPAVPTPEEIEAAARILMRAWAPGLLLPGDHPKTDDIADDGIDPDEYCGCAGTDDDGESYCNCGGGCVCDSCTYYAYASYKKCWVKGCGKTPAYRAVRFGMVSQHVQEPTALGAVCPHAEGEDHFCTPDTVYIAAGPQLQVFSYAPACSIAHAVQLRDGMRQRSRPGREQYYLETWTYTPHDNELPAPLPQLREYTGSARDAATWSVKNYAEKGDPGFWLESARRHIALAAWHARRDLERPGEDDDFDDEPSTPVQEEPTEPDGPDAPW